MAVQPVIHSNHYKLHCAMPSQWRDSINDSLKSLQIEGHYCCPAPDSVKFEAIFEEMAQYSPETSVSLPKRSSNWERPESDGNCPALWSVIGVQTRRMRFTSVQIQMQNSSGIISQQYPDCCFCTRQREPPSGSDDTGLRW